MAKKQTKRKTQSSFRNRITGLEYHPPVNLRRHEKNPREHGEGQRSALRALLDDIGVAGAVVAYRSERNGGAITLIDGHLRSDLLDGDVPVLMTDLNDEEADRLLASFDQIGEMADVDVDRLDALLSEVSAAVPRDLMRLLDPDASNRSDALPEEANDQRRPKYEITPQFDEGYDFVAIFATCDSDFNWLCQQLDIRKKRHNNKVGKCHVLTVQEFKQLWQTSRSSS